MKRKSAKPKKAKSKAVTSKVQAFDAAAWLEENAYKTLDEAKRSIEAMNDSNGYEKYPMPGDFRTEKEKYQSHMVIVVRKDELPDFSKMSHEAAQAWCAENDASPYLQRRGSNAIKALLWALRRWKNVKPKSLEPGEYKVLNRHEELPKFIGPLEQEAFWKTHRLSESLIKRLSGQELRDLGWKEHGKRVDGSKPIKTPKNPIRTPEGRILITRASDIPDWSKLTYKEDADWWSTHEIDTHLRRPATAKERVQLFKNLGIEDPRNKTRRKKRS